MWLLIYYLFYDEKQPLCDFSRHSCLNEMTCTSMSQYRPKDVSTQVWQTTANTNMMFEKQFYKQVLAKRQWTNSNHCFHFGNSQAVTSFRNYVEPFSHTTQRILFTRLKHWVANQCQKSGTWESNFNSTTEMNKKSSVRQRYQQLNCGHVSGWTCGPWDNKTAVRRVNSGEQCSPFKQEITLKMMGSNWRLVKSAAAQIFKCIIFQYLGQNICHAAD